MNYRIACKSEVFNGHLEFQIHFVVQSGEKQLRQMPRLPNFCLTCQRKIQSSPSLLKFGGAVFLLGPNYNSYKQFHYFFVVISLTIYLRSKIIHQNNEIKLEHHRLFCKWNEERRERELQNENFLSFFKRMLASDREIERQCAQKIFIYLLKADSIPLI